MFKHSIFSKVIATGLCLAVALTPTAAPAGAGGIVFDPTNWIENLRSAISAVQQEALQTSQLAQLVQQVATAKNQYEQMKNDALRMRKSLKGMSAGEILGLAKNLGPEYQTLYDLNRSVQSASGKLRTLADHYQWMEGFGVYMGWDVTQVYSNERLRRTKSKNADRSFLTNIERTMRSVNDDIVTINRIRDNIADSQLDDQQSMRKALETMTVQLNLMAGQNTQLLSLMSEDAYARRAESVGDRIIKEQMSDAAYYRAWEEFYKAEMRRSASEARARSSWNAPGVR